jgi:hypothetical protein
MLLLFIACFDDGADVPEAPPAPTVSVDEIPLGARFVEQVWGSDITPEQSRRFELVAGQLQQAEAERAGARAERVKTLARVVAQEPTSVTTAEDAARAIALQDGAMLRARVAGLCTLYDTLSVEQRLSREAAGRVVPVLAEGLPRSGTNSFDFSAPLLRRHARDVQVMSRRVDGAWAPVAAAVLEAEPRLAEIHPSQEGWCGAYRGVLEPVHEAWDAWHRQSLMSFSAWLVRLPAAERASFTDAGGLESALQWSVGSVEKGVAARR